MPYLKPNVIVEPLFNQWYAWSYLIFPATAARYITESHLKIMQSFVDAPQVHQSALKNPAMMGAPFINYEVDRVHQIKALLEKTKEEQAHLVQLSQAIAQLDTMLTEEAKGYSLEPLYQNVPEALKGYVELVYDSNNHPSIRFIEGLLYKSQYYNPASQTVALYLGQEDERSFVLSTPRLKDERYLHLNFPFNDSRLDRLFQMRDIPQPYTQIKNLLGIAEEDEALFSLFFTEEPPQKEPKYSGDSVRIRYFGHACVLIETKDISILLDPLISYQHQEGIPRYTYADLPETIDYALITHNHQDHCMFETLLQLRHKIKHLVVPKSNSGVLLDPSMKLILKTIGFANVIEIDNLEAIDINEGQIVALPFLGEHGDLNISAKAAYLIQLKGQSILCLADSNNIEPKLYETIQKIFGDIDVIFIGMECDGAPFSWAYGSLLTKSIPRKMGATRRLDGSNADRAFELVSQFNPQQVYVYAMGQEPWLIYITSIQYTEESRPIIESNKLVEACRNRNIFSERLLGKKEILLEKNPKQVPNVKFATNYNKHLNEKKVTQSVDEFLAKLSRLDIKLWVDEDRLRCNAPKGALTPTLKTQLSDRKAEILEFLSNKSNGSETLALLNADAILDSSIRAELLTQPTVEPSCILLTGATGFVGAFLLYELLQQTSCDVYCLIRANSTELAHNKLRNYLESYLLWEEGFSSRIIPVIGDLSQPLLGLSESQFHELADTIDVIYHNGAWVHHASPYSLLKATNVLGTQEVLRLACQTKVKPVHLISATSVFSGVGDSGVRVVREQDNIDNGQVPFGGYNQSKWVAEKLVNAARDRGLPVCIYRLGRISGHSLTGVFNVNDFLYRLIIGCVQLGSIPDVELIQDIIPVDYASKAIIHLSKLQNSWGKAFHLTHPQPVSTNLFFEKLRSLGYPIQQISYDQWHTQLLNIAQNSPEHALYPLVSLLPGRNNNSQAPTSDSAVLKFDFQNTLNGLKNTSITCPTIDDQLLNIYFSYLIKNNFLVPPPIKNSAQKSHDEYIFSNLTLTQS
ncbi:thioester reductase domain-containing protein [Nostoc sp. 'Lobaria pulmonaria (5183) cyanobiont']|uniref:thioester reductase domain-containing protein n=1 Tax=Nostoc sp. 'Lobaria pulmonaria (5183) cyanobiont' TaxID=1618022 RepID=UPI000CF35965|nr:thioester reductase domain-containing protein [Nostoc sp. 'Lobaria pulmonaria (5183) cyanobiont']AVH69221.1 thioester reductase domain protein [Nostoc sp. 'Lobaria pulmonaria (5183) cyanobiont']